MKLKLLLTTLLSAFSFSANADLLSFEVGTGKWNHDPSGQFRYDVGGIGDNLDLQSGLGFKEEDDSYTYAVIRHAVPLFPNVKVMSAKVIHEGSGSGFDFGGQTYPGTVTTKMVLDHTDVTAFWNFLDTGLTFDLGLTARQLDGEAIVDDGTPNTTAIDGTIPMIYVGLAVSPIDSLRFSVEANYTGSGDTTFTDTIAKVSYHTDFLLGIEAGVRNMAIDLDDQNGNYADMDFSGSFVGVSLKF